ncbi:hypothetical protein Hanom_Chr04g00339301 [Helianthus anomalus]
MYIFVQPDAMYGPNYNDNQRLKVFASNLEDVLGKYEVKKLEIVDLIFIPVLLSNHLLCICFHLKMAKLS